MSKSIRIAALGSSFAAGPGIAPLADKRAGRSTRNYAALLAERLGAHLTDLSVSGATTATVAARAQRVLGRTYPPQVEALRPHHDIVTLTVGGNDVGYIGSLVKAAWVSSLGLTRLPRFAALESPAIPDAAFDRCRSNLIEVVTLVRARSPHARVILTDYMTLCGRDTVPHLNISLSATAVDAFRDVGSRLNSAIESAAEATQTTFVAASRLSEDHGIGAKDQWVSGFRTSLSPSFAPFHPNLAGMRAIAEAIHAALE